MEKPNNKGINLSASAIHALLLLLEQLSKTVLVKKDETISLEYSNHFC